MTPDRRETIKAVNASIAAKMDELIRAGDMQTAQDVGHHMLDRIRELRRRHPDYYPIQADDGSWHNAADFGIVGRYEPRLDQSGNLYIECDLQLRSSVDYVSLTLELETAGDPDDP